MRAKGDLPRGEEHFGIRRAKIDGGTGEPLPRRRSGGKGREEGEGIE